MAKTKTLGKWFSTGFKGFLTGLVSSLVSMVGYWLGSFIFPSKPMAGLIVGLIFLIAQIPLWGFIANRFWGWE